MQTLNYTMDKLNIRAGVTSAPAVRSHDKTKKDYAVNNSYQVSEAFPPRKSVSQKEKALDKRPRQRGYYSDAAGTEVKASCKSKCKKANINHLLNFTYDTGDVGADCSPRRRGEGMYRQSRVRYSKEQYLQANCQFIVKEGADYTALTADADQLVDWSLIEQLRVRDHEIPSCPICLYPPTVAKITRCGHVYCWACVLHYLSLSDGRSSSRCPICFQEVAEKDLKSVSAGCTKKYVVGEKISMSLMRRERGSTYVQCKSQWSGHSQSSNCYHYVDEGSDGTNGFLKFILARPADVQGIIDSERSSLLMQLKECGGSESLEGSYVIAALKLLKEREFQLHSETNYQKLSKDGVPPGALGLLNNATDTSELPAMSVSRTASMTAIHYASAFDDEANYEGISDINICASSPPHYQQAPNENSLLDNIPGIGDDVRSISPERELTALAEVNQPTARASCKHKTNTMTDVYYFYQSADGQQIYLHSLNARCLAAEYGNLEMAPNSISATIVELEDMTMTEELRRRLRYLSHVPLSCQFTVAELALEPPLVSPRSLQLFGEEIKKRHHGRHRKTQNELHLTKKAELEEARRMGKFPDLCISLTNEQHFPDVMQKDSNLASEVVFLCGISDSIEESTAASNASCKPDQTGSGRTFAETLLASGSRSATVGQPEPWCRRISSLSPTGASALSASTSATSNYEEMAAPLYQTSFGNAIQAAFENLSVTQDDHGASLPSSGGKKKKKQKLLFSTSIARAKC